MNKILCIFGLQGIIFSIVNMAHFAGDAHVNMWASILFCWTFVSCLFEEIRKNKE